MRNIFSTAIAILCCISIFSQTTSIEGKVTKIGGTNAMVGVSVYLENSNLGTVTKTNGSYTIANVPVGTHTIVVSYIGYLTVKKQVNIEVDKKTTKDFILKETIADLPEVTITGGKIGIQDIPGSAHYISPKDLEKFNYTDINQILRTVPGVNIQEEDGFGLFPSIGLRGTGVERNTKITVMEDGILIAPAPYAAPAAYYFPTMGRMQGVEVVKGSSQIKYGPYTTGGAINLISTQISNEFSGKVSLWGGSFGGRNLHAVIGNSHKNFAYMVETFQYGSDGFKQLDGAGNRGIDRSAGFNKQDYMAKFRVNTNVDAKVYQSLAFKMAQAIGDIDETYLGLTQEDFDASPTRRYAGSQMDNIQTEQTQFSITHKARFSEAFAITTITYRTNFARNWYKLDRVIDNAGATTKIAKLLDNPIDYSRAFDIVKGISSIDGEALRVKANNRNYYSQGIQTTLNLDFETEKAKHTIDLSIRVHEDQIDRFQWYDNYAMDNGLMELISSGVHGTESNRVETANATAAYVQYQLKIGKLTATPGIRYERIMQERLDYGNTDTQRTGTDLSKRSNTTNVFIPGIGFDYRFGNHLSAFLGIHKGFAPPGSKEELEPEKSVNYELGTRYSTDGLSGQAVLFFNNYSNLLGADLEAAGGGGTNEQFNGGAVKAKGLEFDLTYDLLFSKNESKFSLPLTLVYTYTDARFLNDFDSDFGAWGEVSAGDQFPYLAKNQFTIALGLENRKFSLNLNGRYIDEMRTVPGQGKIPLNEKTNSYFVVDASASFNLHKNISLFGNITNATNQVYVVARRPAGLRPGLPRNFNIGLRASF